MPSAGMTGLECDCRTDGWAGVLTGGGATCDGLAAGGGALTGGGLTCDGLAAGGGLTDGLTGGGDGATCRLTAAGWTAGARLATDGLGHPPGPHGLGFGPGLGAGLLPQLHILT